MNAQSNTTGVEVKKEDPYYWYEDGNKHKIKVVNLNNLDNCPRKGVIEIEALKKQSFGRTLDFTVNVGCTKDKATGVHWGVPLGNDPDTGQVKWMNIQLGMINIFDLSVEAEAIKSAIILRSPVVEGSPNAVWRLLKYRVHDKEKVAMQKIRRVKDSRRAIEVASGLFGEGLLNMGRNLLLPIESMSSIMLEAEVLERAEKDPVEFLRIHDSPHYEVITILNNAVAMGVVENDARAGYMFKGVNIGSNESQAIDYLIRHKDVAGTIDFQSKAKLSDTQKLISEQTANEFNSGSDKDNEIENLKRQLAESKSAMDKLTTDKIIKVNKEESGQDVELAELVARAKALKIPGAHAYKSPEAIEKLKGLVKAKEMETV